MVTMEYYDKTKVYLETRNEMTDSKKELLSLSGLNDFAPVQVWSACGTNMQMAYSTHGIFRFFGKFPPPIATYLINKYSKINDVILDPMCGSGTTGVESILNNRKCILNDVNDLSILLSKVKSTFIDIRRINTAFEEIKSKYRPLNESEYDFTSSYLKNYSHWFLDETVNSLRGLKYLIKQIKKTDLRNYFEVCLASIVRRVSRATTQQGRLFLDVETAEKDALPFFIKKLKIQEKQFQTYPRMLI